MADETLKDYITGLTELTTIDPSNDILLVYDASASALKKIKPNNVLLESFSFALSDETTDLATGTSLITWRVPYAFTVTAVRASVNTAPTGSTIVVDINESGVSILSTKLSIDATEKTSTTAATPAVISDASLVDDAEISFDIDQVGSTIAGAGLKVTIIGHRT
jgi:hypothetical protein